MKQRMNHVFYFYVMILVFLVIFPRSSGDARNYTTSSTIRVNAGVIVDYGKWSGKMELSCIKMALWDLYASCGSDYKTRLVLHVKDSNKDVVEAAAAALDLINHEEVQAIIGPGTPAQTNFVIDLGNKAKAPIISYSATSPSVDMNSSPYFFRATQNEAFQVKAISSIVQAHGWRYVVPIYADDAYVKGLIPFLTDALQEVDARIPYRSAVSPSATDDQLVEELYKLMTMQTRVFVVHMHNSLASRLFTKASEIEMMTKGFVWIVTSMITNQNLLISSMGSSDVRSMQGVLGIRTYIPETEALKIFRDRWKRQLQQDNIYPAFADVKFDLNLFGLWAYDAAVALAMAVEEAYASENIGVKKRNNVVRQKNSSTDVLRIIRVSEKGPKLRRALSSVRFKGFAGDFNLVDRQLQSSTFQIINVNGNGEREIGFWTQRAGLVRNLNSTRTSTNYSSLKANLGPIIWPGESIIVPKGWVIPTNGKALRIGVPLKRSFEEFVKVTHDGLRPNSTDVTGYCIDIFKAVLELLPYSVPYVFAPFPRPDRSPISSYYDDLIYQVQAGKFDAVVGDTTIRANRSLYVDFTFPYTESGIAMVIPVKDKGIKNAWVFLKPLTWDLWVTSIFFFVFIAFVIWVLEHKRNKNFRGPMSHQIGTSFWFSFSTMVFAHREKVISNLARFVLIIWIFVVLILTQSYAASLTTLLTVQQLQPRTVTEYVAHLLKNGKNVGYFEGSFVHGMLKELGFDDSKLKDFKSLKDLDDAFSSKSANGGISAAFEEVPYMKLFIKRYCSKYTMMLEPEQSFKTDGFGFAFPKGSPLVADISRATIELTEQVTTMKKIEKKWFEKGPSCRDINTQDPSILSLESFWGLFLIAGVSSMFALLLHFAVFLYGQWHIITSSDPATSRWEKIRLIIFEMFGHQKDSRSHTPEQSTSDIEIIANTSNQPSNSNSDLGFPGDQQVTSSRNSP